MSPRAWGAGGRWLRAGLGLGAVFGLALALRWRCLPLVMTLGDSLGPWWVAWRGPWQTTPHAPPYGWLLALPHAAILPFARSLWQAEAALLALHALVAPVGAALAAAAAPRGRAAVVGAAVGGLLAVDPGLIDTAVSGAEGYLGALWLGMLVALGPAAPPAIRPALGAAAFSAAAMNHPLGLCAAPLLWPACRGARGAGAWIAGIAVGAVVLGPHLLGLWGAAQGAAGPGAGPPGAAGGALRAYAQQGGPAALLIGLGPLVGLGARRTRALSAATLLSLGLLLLVGEHLGALRDHHLRLLSLPAAAGWAALSAPALALALLLLRPAPDPLARPGAHSRPGTLGMTHALGLALSRPGGWSSGEAVLVDGVLLGGGVPAAEPGGLVLDRLLRARAAPAPDGSSDLVLILSFARGAPPALPAGGRALWAGDTAALWRLPRAAAEGWALPPGAAVGGAMDGLVLLDPAADAALTAWAGSAAGGVAGEAQDPGPQVGGPL